MKNLLQITQEILSDINGDEVDSIFDTEESEQVARSVIASYNNLMSKKNWAHQRKLLNMEGLESSTRPNYMKIPDEVKEVIVLNFDKAKVTDTRKKFEEIKYLDPDQFIHYTNGRNDSDSNVVLITDFNGVELAIRNDEAPQYYTTFDDTYVIFDAWDSAVSDEIDSTQCTVLAYVLFTLELQDTATPDLPLDAERLLIEEATARAAWKQNEFRDIESIAAAQSQRRTLSQKEWRLKERNRYPDYGRNTNKRGYSKHPTFERNKY